MNGFQWFLIKRFKSINGFLKRFKMVFNKS